MYKASQRNINLLPTLKKARNVWQIISKSSKYYTLQNAILCLFHIPIDIQH